MPDAKVTQALPTLLQRLRAAYPNARYELNWDTPLQLLVATILAAQCTDERVNQVTPALFKKYPTAKAYADANLAELEEDLRPTGFYRQKAQTVQEVCKALVDRYKGEVPPSMEEMLTLPRVARKTANVVLNNAFQVPSGVIVDTHVQRVSQRLGLTDQKKPEKIEQELMDLVPKDDWIFFGPALVLHGRYTCTFHAPRCAECVLSDLCPRRGVGDQTEDPPPAPQEDSPPMAAKKTPARSASKKTAPATKAKPAPPADVPSLANSLPPDWRAVLAPELTKPYFKKLEAFVASERRQHAVFPPEEDMFNALRLTPFDRVKVVLLGQDPYHDEGQAHGLAFSVRPGVKPPPSLLNIFKELQDDLGCKPPPHGYLVPWARQGVLLLNTVLTVRAHHAGSHKDQGWETFTDSIIRALGARPQPAVFLLWGASAQKKAYLIDTKRHRVLTAAHPSPLSAKKFFGSKPFSSANAALKDLGLAPVDWQLPEKPSDDSPATVPAPAPVAALPAPKPQPQPAVKPAAPAPAPVSPPAPAAARVAPPPAPSAKPPATQLEALLPPEWRAALADELAKPSFRDLDTFLADERRSARVFPAPEDVFNAFKYTPPQRVSVVLLGQEPFSDAGVADGLSFSVQPGVEPSVALQTMFRELRDDLGCRLPVTGSLVPWAHQGVLLLNMLLTVREGRPGSHKDKGWETFTDGVLKVVNAKTTPVVFVLLGHSAQKKRSLVDSTRHVILTGEHPAVTPDKFLGSGLFSAINNALELRGQSAIYWQLPYV